MTTFDQATAAVFPPGDPLCVLCGGMDAHMGACYDHPEHRQEMHRRMCEVRDRVAREFDRLRAAQHRADVAFVLAQEPGCRDADKLSWDMTRAVLASRLRDAPPPPLAPEGE